MSTNFLFLRGELPTSGTISKVLTLQLHLHLDWQLIFGRTTAKRMGQETQCAFGRKKNTHTQKKTTCLPNFLFDRVVHMLCVSKCDPPMRVSLQRTAVQLSDDICHQMVPLSGSTQPLPVDKRAPHQSTPEFGHQQEYLFPDKDPLGAIPGKQEIPARRFSVVVSAMDFESYKLGSSLATTQHFSACTLRQGTSMRHYYWLALGWMSILALTCLDCSNSSNCSKVGVSFPAGGGGYRTIVSCLWNPTVRANFPRSHKGLKSGVQNE